MFLPPAPKLLPRQRFAGRFWDRTDLMEVLAVYHGCTAAAYPYSWQYRTLIAAHRAIYNTIPYRKGWGPDWKADIKKDLVAYLRTGTLPVLTMPYAAGRLREAELLLWAYRRAQRLEHASAPALLAAE